MLKSIMQQDNIPIDMSSSEEPMSLSEYLESWRMKVWDIAYAVVFKGADSFKKSDSFRAYKGSTVYVRRCRVESLCFRKTLGSWLQLV